MNKKEEKKRERKRKRKKGRKLVSSEKENTLGNDSKKTMFKLANICTST